VNLSESSTIQKPIETCPILELGKAKQALFVPREFSLFLSFRAFSATRRETRSTVGENVPETEAGKPTDWAMMIIKAARYSLVGFMGMAVEYIPTTRLSDAWDDAVRKILGQCSLSAHTYIEAISV
jgi:hypothetical protein